MARTSKSRGASAFTMKSGNKTTFKMMGSSSPMHVAGTPETYAAAIDAVTSGMSDDDLRKIAVDQHKTGTRGFDVSMKTLKQKRRSLNKKNNEEQPEVSEEKAKNVKKQKKQQLLDKIDALSSDSDELTGYVISNEDQERIFTQHGGGVLEGSELEARNKALAEAASRYGGQ